MEQFDLAIIDGDSIAWIIGYRHKDNTLEGQVIADVDTFMQSLITSTGASSVTGYLGNLNKSSIRRDLVPGYKSNRGETPDWYKQWGKVIDQHLVTRWGFQYATDGYEADDMIAAAAVEAKNFVICGVDKDLKQIPGHHYNYNKNEVFQVLPDEGDLCLAKQVITGDSTDGIKGLPGYGPKKAEKVLAGLPEGVNLMIPVLNEYITVFGQDQGVKQFYQNYMQVKLHADIPDFELKSVPADFSGGTIPLAGVPTASAPAVEEDNEYDMDNLFRIAS